MIESTKFAPIEIPNTKQELLTLLKKSALRSGNLFNKLIFSMILILLTYRNKL